MSYVAFIENEKNLFELRYWNQTIQVIFRVYCGMLQANKNKAGIYTLKQELEAQRIKEQGESFTHYCSYKSSSKTGFYSEEV